MSSVPDKPPTYDPTQDPGPKFDQENKPNITTGGRRHKGSKKMHKGKRHGNASLRAWVTFVKKVQREEKVSYKEAMMRAKQRKDKGEKWRGGGDMEEETVEVEEEEMPSEDIYEGGRRRRRRRTRGRSRSRSHKRTRSHRRSRRHH
jgi:hypothetical protein